MLHQASARPALATRLIQADCVAIPLRTCSVDLAILSLGLGYVEDLSGLAKELSRVLRTEGQLILADFHPDAQARGWKRSFRQGETVVEISSFPRTLERIRDAFSSEYFRLVRCMEQPFGELDRALFDQCGRPDLFRKVFGNVAIFVCVYRRCERPAL
jgi:ubiquinone/menaquinone biosynthesis C-methylase UbiE